MAEVKWIKLMTDMFDNSKIKYLRTLPEGDSIVLFWVMLLTKAGKCNSNGYIFLTENIPYTQEMLATEFGFDLNTVKLSLESLKRLNMIQIKKEVIEIANWNEYQNIEGLDKIRYQTRKRVAKHREKQKQITENAKSNVTSNVTVTQCNATEEEQEEEKNKNKNKNKNTTTSSIEKLSCCSSDFNIFKYFQQRGFVSISSIMAQEINTLVEMYSLEEVKKAVDISDDNGKHTLSYVKGILQNRRAGIKKEKSNQKELEDWIKNETEGDAF